MHVGRERKRDPDLEEMGEGTDGRISLSPTALIALSVAGGPAVGGAACAVVCSGRKLLA